QLDVQETRHREEIERLRAEHSSEMARQCGDLPAEVGRLRVEPSEMAATLQTIRFRCGENTLKSEEEDKGADPVLEDPGECEGDEKRTGERTPGSGGLSQHVSTTPQGKTTMASAEPSGDGVRAVRDRSKAPGTRRRSHSSEPLQNR
ncbi:hypothetical protein LTR60_005207, partial [Cryomyces antarcticus]